VTVTVEGSHQYGMPHIVLHLAVQTVTTHSAPFVLCGRSKFVERTAVDSTLWRYQYRPVEHNFCAVPGLRPQVRTGLEAQRQCARYTAVQYITASMLQDDTALHNTIRRSSAEFTALRTMQYRKYSKY
jgi:hypothetical protein